MRDNKKLSPFRILVAIAVLLGLGYLSIKNFDNVREQIIPNSRFSPWFSAYVDVTAKPMYAFEQVDLPVSKQNAVLSFIVSGKDEPCTPTWGTFYTLDQANLNLDLDRKIARLRQKEGNVVVSFGGLLNDELAVNCKDNTKLLTAYKAVIDRYNLDTIDLDLEGESLANKEALQRRAKVMAELQKMYKAEGKSLAIWLTLPVTPQGLTQDGTDAIANILSNGVDLSGVNVMTMDYGDSKEKNQSMAEASEKALTQTHRQLGILYRQAGISLSESSLWAKIGATPMIGQNDVAGEVFTLDDAKRFNEFAASKRIGRMSMWSANRDIECGQNYVNTAIVSDSCSGVTQEKHAFSALLSINFDGNISDNASLITVSTQETEQKIDDPLTSPYQIWSEEGVYLEGTKVVWHQNVYQAKWWTKGDLPDNPVLEYWETPWELIGPVLPGEKPIPQPTLPSGIYPIWSGETIYDEGQIVLFNGIPFKAKWWTQGDSPAAASANPDSSPWKSLTREEVEAILND